MQMTYEKVVFDNQNSITLISHDVLGYCLNPQRLFTYLLCLHYLELQSLEGSPFALFLAEVPCMKASSAAWGVPQP